MTITGSGTIFGGGSRAVLKDTVDSLADHFAVREQLARQGVEAETWRRDALESLETAVTAVLPILRELT